MVQMLTCLNRSGSWLEGLKSPKRSKFQTKFLFSSSVCQLSFIPGFFLLRAFSLFRFHYLSALCPTHKQLFPFIYSMHTWKRISSCLCEPFLQRQVWVERPLGSRCRYCRTERWSILDHCGTTEGGAKGGVGAKSVYTCEDAGCSTLSLECLPFRHCSQTFPESLTHLSADNSISISCQYPAMNSNSIYVHSFFPPQTVASNAFWTHSYMSYILYVGVYTTSIYIYTFVILIFWYHSQNFIPLLGHQGIPWPHFS